MSKDNTNQNELFEVEAKEIAGLLDAHAQRLSMRTLKQLEDGRNAAVLKHQKRDGVSVNADGTLSHWAAWIDQHRIAFASLILLAIISSFVLVQSLNGNETSDAFLLGADLPPEAFVDQGFEPSLNGRGSI